MLGCVHLASADSPGAAAPPRYAFGAGAFVLLQPEQSFARRQLPDEPEGPVRAAVRAAFDAAGRAYSLPPTARYAVRGAQQGRDGNCAEERCRM